MASITKQANGFREVQFIGADGKRRTIRLGAVDQKTAETFRVRIEDIRSAQDTGEAPSPSTSKWLKTLGTRHHERLARAGLCMPRVSDQSRVVTLDEMLRQYIERRDDVKPGTKLIFEQVRRHLVRFFGRDRAFANITVAEAADFRRAVRRDYSEAYTAKLISRARTIWRDGVDRKWVSENVFARVPTGSQVNTANHRYLDTATVERVMAVCTDPQWKLLLALSRYGGLRCPSEHLALKWHDIDWTKGRITVRAAKTEHHPNKGIRLVPLFPTLRAYLEPVFRERDQASEFVITRYRSASCNLRTQLIRFIIKAGLEPWPRLFHNLRASCQTDLAERFPAHVVCDWIGNSEAVARRHYLQTTDDHFAKACEEVEPPSVVEVKSDAESDAASGGSTSQDTAARLQDSSRIAEMLRDAIARGELRSKEWALQGSNL